jgi:Domain of unknown function (DUF5076)
MTTDAVKSLAVPPDVVENGGQEVLRAFVSEGALSISLIRAFDAPDMWGMLFVDLVRHVSRIYASEVGFDEIDVQMKILGMMSAELLDPTDLGITTTLNN